MTMISGDHIGSDLTRAVQAGIRIERLKTALLMPPPAPAEDVVISPAEDPPPPRHWLRVLGRRGLRLFRPLALPFLNRFEWRVRTAVDKSLFAAAMERQVEALERQIEALETRLEHEAVSTREQSHKGLAELRLAQEHVTARLDGLARDTISLRQRGAIPLTGGDYLVRSPSGWLVTPGEDERLLMAMIESGGVLEPGTAAVLMALLRPGDTMVDVGAHIGTMTLPAARAIGPEGRVIAAEPAARTAALLRRSLHINSLTEYVTLHECAAGAMNGEAVLHIAPVLGENSLIPHAGIPHTGQTGGHTSERVAVRPLDDLVPRGPVRVVKIDAEGYELEVWKGMRRIIVDNPELAVIIEFGPSHLARAGISIADWFDALQVPGFTAWEIDEGSQTLRTLRPLTERAAVFSMNLLLSRLPPAAYRGLRIS